MTEIGLLLTLVVEFFKFINQAGGKRQALATLQKVNQTFDTL
jgi:hypothetical protein